MGNRTIHRSSITGRIVTEGYADRHPRTTETERVYIPPVRPVPTPARPPYTPPVRKGR